MKQDRRVVVPRVAWAFILICLATVLGIVLASNRLADHFYLNIGFIRLNSALSRQEFAPEQKAMASFKSIHEDAPENLRAWSGITLAFVSRGEIQSAAQAMTKSDTSVFEVRQWAERATRVNQWDEAEKWYQLATVVEPDNGDNWAMSGAVSAQLGMFETAGTYYLQALAAPKHPTIKPSSIMMRLAELAKEKDTQDWNQVREWYDRAIEASDFTSERDIYQARLGRAEASEQLQRYRSALEDYRWVAERQPRNYWANYHSGRLIWQIEQDATTAERYLRNAIDVDEQRKWAYRELGIIFSYNGDLNKAIEMFRKVLSIDPEDRISKSRLENLIESDES